MTFPVQNDVVPFIQYTATGGQTLFPYGWLIYSASDLHVYQRAVSSTPDDASQILQLGVDYTVDGVGNQSGGNVTLVTGATLNDNITITRSLPLARQTDFVPGNVSPDSINLELNNLLGMIQDLNMALVKISPTYNFDGVFNIDNMKLPQLGPNELWQMNSLGTGIQTVALTETDPGALILRADLASHAVGKGGSLVGLTSGQTVQQFADSLEDNVIYGLDTSVTPNLITVTFSPPLASYQEGTIYIVRVANDNAAASAVNFNGLGDLPLNYMEGQDLLPGDLLQHKNAVMTYVANNGSPYVQLLNPDFESQIAAAGITKALTAKIKFASNQTISSGSYTKANFNTVEWDDNSFFDNTNERLVLNKLGKFKINARIITDNAISSMAIMAVYINGSFYEAIDYRVWFNATGAILLSGNSLYKNTDITTYVEIYIAQANGRVLQANICKFYIEYLGTN